MRQMGHQRRRDAAHGGKSKKKESRDRLYTVLKTTEIPLSAAVSEVEPSNIYSGMDQ